MKRSRTLRGRLTAARASLAALGAVAVAHRRVQPVLDRSLDADADKRAARAGRGGGDHGRPTPADACACASRPTTRRSTRRSGSTRARARRAPDARRPTSQRRGRRARRPRRASSADVGSRRSASTRCRSRAAARQVGTVVAAHRWPPTTARPIRADRLARAGGRAAGRGRASLTLDDVGRALGPVREMTALGGRLERARPRRGASARRRAPDELGELAAHVRRAARPPRGEPAPRAAPVGRALARAAHAAGADRGRARAAAAPRALAPRSAARPTRSSRAAPRR